MDPVVARKTWRTLEPIHAMVYFAFEAQQAFVAAGLEPGAMGYFASRSAGFGEASAETVIATFYNFDPDLVRSVIPRAWALASPAAVLEARLKAADSALKGAWGAEAVGSSDLAEAAGLARRVAEAATSDLQGRPLFAAHASLPWPGVPHLVLWHSQSLLREFRGDGHVAALLLSGTGPVEALALHVASGETPEALVRTTRGWSDDAWNTAVEGLRAEGLLAPDGPLALTEKGRELRQSVEDRTDAAAIAPYRAIGEDACARLRQLCRPLSKAIVDLGMFQLDPARTGP